MDNNEKEFENFVRGIKFDDTPDPSHRDKLEQELLLALAKQPRQIKIWRTIMKSRITKFAAAAAVIIIAVLIGISTFSGTSAWAQIVQALNEVENVHVVAKTTMADGTTTQYEVWLKRPDYLYEDYPDRITIDNGKERLTIDKRKKEAQFSDSLMPYQPLLNHFVFEEIGLFRNNIRTNKRKGLEITQLADESDETTLVYALKYRGGQLKFSGRAWVQAETMLPTKIEVYLTGQSKKGELKAGEITFSFNYAPIPDDIFAMVVPKGYTELPRKERGVLSGTVLDKDGQAVDNAVVYAVDLWGGFVKSGKTNEEGCFSFKLPPEGANKFLFMPVFLRAFSEDDPNSVAWTIINNPAVDRDIGAEIPGELGEIEFEGAMLKNATGIIIKMEPAGRIFGKVMDSNGRPLANVPVELIDCNPVVKWRNAGMSLSVKGLGGAGKRGRPIVKTDEQGRYEFKNLPKFGNGSSFTLSGSLQGYVSTSARFRCRTPLENERVDIKLFKAGLTVSGKLIDNYGQPLAARNISAIATIGNCRAYCGTETDESGRFRIDDCPVTEDLQIKAELSHNHTPPHEKEKYLSYRYHPDVVVGIDYQQGKREYEVEMVAERPEFVVEVELVNSKGEPLAYFPVEVRGAPGTISSQWKSDKQLERRTDENGYCKFTEVPNVKDLRVVMWGRNSVWKDSLNKEEAKEIAQKYEKYKWTEVPIELIPGQKEYKIEVTILTNEEYERKK